MDETKPKTRTRKKKTETTVGNGICPDCGHPFDEHKKGGKTGQAGEAVLCIHVTNDIRCQCEIKPPAETPANSADEGVTRSDIKTANDAPDGIDELDLHAAGSMSELFPDLAACEIADVAYMSGYFPGRTPAQLLIAIMAGQEMQLHPIASLFDLELSAGSIRWKPGQPAQAAGDAIERGREYDPGNGFAARGHGLEIKKDPEPGQVVDFPPPAVIPISDAAAAVLTEDAKPELDLNEFLDALPTSAVDAVAEMSPADDDPFATGPDGIIVGVDVPSLYAGPERRKEQMPPFMYDSERRLTPYENANKRPVTSTEPERPLPQAPAQADATGQESGEARAESAGSIDQASGPIGDDPVIAAADAGSGVALDDNADGDVVGPRDDERDAAGWREAINSVMTKHGFSTEVIEARLKQFDDSEQDERRHMFDQVQEYHYSKLSDWTTKILAEITNRGFAEVKAFALFAGVPGESSLWTWEDCDKATGAINTLPEQKPAA